MKKQIPFKRLLKSKKGGIPAINEIVLTILNITPKPILLLIFILLITTIATFIIPIFLGLFGYDCVYESGSLELYQVPIQSIAIKSIQDIKGGFDDLIGLPSYELPEDPFPYGNKSFIRIPDGCFETVQNGSEELYGYSALCTDCDAISRASFFGNNITLPYKARYSICIGDGYYAKNVFNLDLFGSRFCSRCSPPTGYYYNHSNIPEHGWVFTIENQSLVPFIDESYYYNIELNRLKELGGVMRSQDSTQFVNLQCTDVHKPTVYFFTIELFNKTMWIFLIVGWGLISFAYLYYSAIGLN